MSRRLSFSLFCLLLLLLAGAPLSANTDYEFGTDWTAHYFNNTTLSGEPVYTEMLPTGINVNWGTGSPNAAVATDNWSARITSTQVFNEATYEFVVSSDDGVRVFIDGSLVWDRFIARVLTTDRFQVGMTAGTHQLTVEYLELVDQAALQFQYFQLGVSSGITGRVTDTTGAGIQGAHISSYTTNGAFVNVGITDGAGYYALNLSPGDYRLVAEKSGYLITYYDGKYNFWSATDVNVSGVTPDINFTLAQPGCITGTLTLPDSVTPADFDQIYVYRAGDPPESSYYDATAFGVTDANGIYTVCYLVPGQYRVEAYDPSNTYPNTFYSGQFIISAAPLVAVNSGETTNGVNFSYLTYGSTAPVLNAPAGEYADSPTEFDWTGVEGADWYHLWLSSQSGKVLENWHNPADVCADTACSVALAELPSGAYRWWAQAWDGETGYGEWSPATWFYVAFQSPPTPLQPSGAVETVTPTFSWNELPGATWYEIWVTDPDGNGTSYWIEAAEACANQLCQTMPLTIGAGNYRWWVQGWSAELGFSGWSGELRFALPSAEPTPLIPFGEVAVDKPGFSWTEVARAEWYYMVIMNESNTPVLQRWYPANLICNGAMCTVNNQITLANGSYRWWIVGWNQVAGLGYWSSEAAFTVAVPAAPLTDIGDPGLETIAPTPTIAEPDPAMPGGPGISDPGLVAP